MDASSCKYKCYEEGRAISHRDLDLCEKELSRSKSTRRVVQSSVARRAFSVEIECSIS